MKVQRMLLCLDASPTALDALRVAVDLAADWRSSIRAIYVVQDSIAAEAIDAASGGLLPPAEERLESAASGLMDHAVHLARAHGIPMESVIRPGEPFEEIVREARRYGPDLVVIGRSRRRGPGPTVLGTVTAHLLEFTEWPVLVVPDRRSEPERS